MTQSKSWTEGTSLPSRGEFVIRDGYVVTMDPGLGDIAGGSVHVRDGEIVAVGHSVDVPPGVEVIDATNQVVLPGFVDTHWHLWNSVLRGVIGDGDREYFPVKNRVAPFFTPEDTNRSARLAVAEGLVAGITTLNDWDHNVRSPEHADANARAILDLGVRARYSYGNADKLDPSVAMDFADIERFGREWVGSASEGRITLGMAMRGPVRTTPEICRAEWAFARDHGLPMTMHCGGRRDESGRYCELEGMALDGYLGPDLQVVHAVFATPHEIDLLADSGTHLSLSPLTELRSMGIPPVGAFLAAGIGVSLSIDTIAIPTRADMFLQMNATISVERGRAMDATLTPRQVLAMATIDGARDLGLDDRIGSLVPGKRADVIAVRLDSLHMAPAADPISLAVYGATPADVSTVAVDGRILKRDGRLTAADPETIVADATATLDDLLRRAGWDLATGVAADVALAG